MKVTCKFFAMLRDRADVDQMALELPAGATVAMAAELLISRMPSLKSNLQHVAFAVNREYVSAETILKDGDELALIPPVSGG